MMLKGLKTRETVKNYLKILEKFNGKNSKSIDRINAVFYCIKYNKGTVVEQMENIIFQNLIKYELYLLSHIVKLILTKRLKIKIFKRKEMK